MKNIITAQIDFSFKGKLLSPSAIIDLDAKMEAFGVVPNLPKLLAQENQIDSYSYEYEVMECTPVIITKAEGMVSQCITTDKQLDIAAFEKHWHEDSVLEKIQVIAKNRLDVADLDNNEALKLALLDAYAVGKSLSDKG